ncbi:hypothetical protein GF359_09890, partial [candidate division WOR-3 bacterium]|nr:hypothetical protein [candidate division WOR-3 bacterium]MBD3365511.1 hypothetical protein [candidate division WOR-3 bacterium]
MKKILPIVTVVLLAGLALSGCATFKAAKAPVKECLTAWKKGDFEKAYSCFVEGTEVPKDEFIEYAKENEVKKFKLFRVSISGTEGATGEIQGTVTLKGGDKTGCLFYVKEISEDVWKIETMEAFDPDLIP